MSGRSPSGPGSRPSGRAGKAVSPVPASIPNADAKPFDFGEMADACRRALEFGFKLEPKNKGKNIPWTGPDYKHANHFAPREALKAERLRYAEEDQGRDKLDEIISVILQLGIEQGRRIRRDFSSSELLDKAYGAVFTIRVGWDNQTAIHTQSGFLANPTGCLTEAIEALQCELSRVSNCPRASAIEAGTGETAGLDAKHESATLGEGDAR